MNPFILKKPVITEKTLDLAKSQNVFTFEVDRLAEKNQIKQAIENLFSVNVLSVNTTMRPAFNKNTGKKRLKTHFARTKKALIQLKKGEKIDLFDIGGEK